MTTGHTHKHRPRELTKAKKRKEKATSRMSHLAKRLDKKKRTSNGDSRAKNTR